MTAALRAAHVGAKRLLPRLCRKGTELPGSKILAKGSVDRLSTGLRIRRMDFCLRVELELGKHTWLLRFFGG